MNGAKMFCTDRTSVDVRNEIGKAGFADKRLIVFVFFKRFILNHLARTTDSRVADAHHFWFGAPPGAAYLFDASLPPRPRAAFN
jgi:hypothetical protein